MDLSSETRFGFGHRVRLRASLWKALRMQECAIVLGSCGFLKSRGESGNTVRLEAGRCLFSFC